MSVNYQPRGSTSEFKSAFMTTDPDTGHSELKLFAVDNKVVSVAAKWLDDLSDSDKVAIKRGDKKLLSVDIGAQSEELKLLCVDVASLARGFGISSEEASRLLDEENLTTSRSTTSASLKSLFNPRLQPHANFRSLDLSFSGYKVQVAGMAHPIRYSTDRSADKSFDTLSKMGFRMLISLDDSAGSPVQATWEKYGGITHDIINIEDFTAPTQDDYDEIFSIVTRAALTNEKVVIHCGEGWGRTGTALASLQLRESFDKMENDEAAGRAYLAMPIALNTPVNFGGHSVGAAGDPLPKVMSTSLVAQALNKVRQNDLKGFHDQSTHGLSVEIKEQLDSLIALEIRLRAELALRYP